MIGLKVNGDLELRADTRDQRQEFHTAFGLYWDTVGQQQQIYNIYEKTYPAHMCLGGLLPGISTGLTTACQFLWQLTWYC